MFFACVVISDIYLFQEIVLSNPCYIFSKKLILSFIDKVTTGPKILALFIWNVAEVVCVFAVAGTGRLAFGLEGTAVFFRYISDITQYLDHEKSSSI